MRDLGSMAVALAWLLVLAGCRVQPVDSVAKTSGPKTTLNLGSNAGGELVFCDLDTDGDGLADANCRTLDNPRGCASVVVEIEPTTGDTCETCLDGDGATIGESCDGVTIACSVVTAPDPDCIVCAHSGGAVVYSTCVSEQPYCDMIDLGGAGNGSSVASDPVQCRVCYDDTGRVILDECGEDCSMVRCAPLDCGLDAEEVLYPGDCCPVCVPRVDCTDVYCAYAGLVPDCPLGTSLVRDPADCCTYRCEAIDCSTIACPNPDITCQAGFRPDYAFPNCCGSCDPDPAQPRYCLADGDCLHGELCSAGIDCLAPPNCDPNAGTCAAVCYGLCRPIDHTCDGGGGNPSVGAYCEGTWLSGGRDAFGCALPPVCICADSTTSFDGVCSDQCANELCFAPPPNCGPGTHQSLDYPFCCGSCVPDDVCINVACSTVECAAGSHLEPDASNPCCGVCVADVTGCFSREDCGPTEVCSVDLGDCGLAPGCAASSAGTGCPTVCYGQCLPRYECTVDGECLWGEACQGGLCVGQPACLTSSNCPVGDSCSTETRGDCLPAPGCDPTTGCLGSPVCYGVCETSNAAPISECGIDLGCDPGFDCLTDTWCPDCVFQDPACAMPCESFGICVPREEPCGDVICSGGLVCCNPLLGICTEPGMVCIQ